MKKTALLILILNIGFAQACGFEFQQMLLHNRQASLAQGPVGMFDQKLQQWAEDFTPPNFPLDSDDGLPNEWGQRDNKDDDERTAIEAKFLTKKQFDLVQQARKADTFDEAKQILAGESGSFVDYTLAVRKPEENKLGEYPVLNRYNDVPKPKLGIDNEPWRLWGIYMMGKTQFRQGHYQAAIETFDEVQKVVADGLSDPLHVAADSLGYQAMAYHYNDQFDEATENYLTLKGMGHSYASLWLKDYARSLVFSYSELYRSPESNEQKQQHLSQLKLAIGQPLTRRLLITYAYTHLGNNYHSLLDLLNSHYTNQPPGTVIEEADQLAAYAYRVADYDSAEKLVNMNNSELSQLIKAKLLLRKGEINQAKSIYANLITELKNITSNNMSSESCSIIADSAILAMSEGDIEQAFDLLVNHTGGEYWQDVAYIAEHLLPTETLVQKSTEISNTHKIKLSKSDLQNESYIVKENIQGQLRAGIEANYPKSLQYLTSRRLAREGNIPQAIELMPHEIQKAKLIELQDMLNQLETTTNKAKLNFALAEWTLKYGPKTLAYEGDPDWLMFNLDYTPVHHSKNPETIELDLKSQKEKRLKESNSVQPYNHRFSYRWKAVEYARTAASLLPPSDPNYENYLCHAASWIINHDPDLARDIFRQFVNKAKPVKDRKYFGVKCNPVENHSISG